MSGASRILLSAASQSQEGGTVPVLRKHRDLLLSFLIILNLSVELRLSFVDEEQ